MNSPKKENKNKYLRDKFLIVVLCTFLASSIFLGILLRSVEILNKNYLFGFDQGRDYLAVRNIVVNHKLTLIGSEIGGGVAGFRGIFQGPFHYYFLSIPFFLTGGDPYSGVVVTFVYGVVTILLGYIFAKKLFAKLGGLFTASLIALSPPLISQSRFVWNSHGAPIFVLLSFYFVYKLSADRENSKYFFAASFFSAFIYNFQIAIAIPMSVALIVYILFILRINKIKQYIFLALGFISAFLPMIFFEMKHGFLATRGLLEYWTNPDKTEAVSKFTELLRDHFGSFILNVYDSFPKQGIVSGEVMAFSLLGLSLYFILKDKNKNLKLFITYILILPFITFIVLAFLRNAVYSYYLLHLVLAYIFILVYILFSAIKTKKIFIGIAIGIFFALSFIKSYPNILKTVIYDYSDYGGTAKIKGKIDAIDYIYQDAGRKEFGLLVFAPPVYTYPYDYLIWWYGERKYLYKPYQEKKGTFYLLIEPDPSKQWSYKGWLETVIRDGVIMSETKLPSGFIVQKRFND